MKAICVTSDRKLEFREVPTPETPPAGHVLVDMDSAMIAHGDKFFLTRPMPGSTGFVRGGLDVYGSNGAGRVAAIGAGVSSRYLGKQVAIYKSLARSPDTIGLWCERAVVPAACCLILPDGASARDYCGSLANVITGYAFIKEIEAAGHRGIIVTAGNSATGYVAASLTRQMKVPAIFLVRSEAAREDLLRHGTEHVIVTTEAGFAGKLGGLATDLGATAVFDGVGGALLDSVLPHLPMDATIYVYGFLGGVAPISLPTMLIMGKNLTLRRFSNFQTATVRDPELFAAAMRHVEVLIDDPLFRTRIGRSFGFDQIEAAMAYDAQQGARAVLVAGLEQSQRD